MRLWMLWLYAGEDKHFFSIDFSRANFKLQKAFSFNVHFKIKFYDHSKNDHTYMDRYAHIHK